MGAVLERRDTGTLGGVVNRKKKSNGVKKNESDTDGGRTGHADAPSGLDLRSYRR